MSLRPKISSDGEYIIRILVPNDTEEVADLYAAVWEKQNYFMREMNITKQDFYPIAHLITSHCARFGYSSVIVHINTGKIIGFTCSAPYLESHDLICAVEMAPNEKLRMWMQFNSELDRLVSPYMQAFDLNDLMYGFATGILDEHIGNGLYFELIYPVESHYKYSITNCVHPVTIKEGEEKYYTYILLRYDWKNWVYNGAKPLANIKVPYCALTLYFIDGGFCDEQMRKILNRVGPKL